MQIINPGGGNAQVLQVLASDPENPQIGDMWFITGLTFAPSNDLTATRFGSAIAGSLPVYGIRASYFDDTYFYGAAISSGVCTLYKWLPDGTGYASVATLFTTSGAGFENGSVQPWFFKDTIDGNKFKCVFIGCGSTAGYLPYVATGDTTISSAMTVNTTALFTRGAGTYDETNIQNPTLYIEGGVYYLYYSGYNASVNTTSNLASCLATSSTFAPSSFTKQGRKLQLSGYAEECVVTSIYKHSNGTYYFVVHGINTSNNPSKIIILSSLTINPTEDSGYSIVGTATSLMAKAGSGDETTQIVYGGLFAYSDYIKLFFVGRNGSAWVLKGANISQT